MTSRRGEDEPKAKHPPEAPAAPDSPARLLTSDDIFGDMLDPPPEAAPPRAPGPPARPSARQRPIKVQVSEPGAARKETGSPGGAGEQLPEDVAALLEAFAEPTSGPAEAEPPRAADAPPAAAAQAPDDDDELLREVLTEGPPDPVPPLEEDEIAASELVDEPALELEAGGDDLLAGELVEEDEAPPAETAPPDPGHAQGLRDLMELQPPRRSILHPLDALGEPPRPASRTGTKFQAAAPKPVAEQGPGLDLAAVAADAFVEPSPPAAPAPVAPAPPPVAPTPPPAPRVLVGGSPYGPYRLLERVAMGGMAEVFMAKRTGVEGFEKVLAVKRILPHLSDNKEFVDMFIDEAKMVAGLAHPNIVQIFDLGKIEKSYYIAMEYVHGRDVRSILRRARERGVRLPLDLSAVVVSKVCSALEFAHRKKDERGRAMMIVHRDISPQNILISFEGEVKLTDFGIAKAATKASITDAGALRGKLLYMSPEQAWGKPMDRRSDVFSLGIVFYEMVTDHRPFLGTSEMSILEMVRECRVAKPSTLNPAVPEKLENVIMMALARDPDDRYQDAAEMYRDLERVLHEGQPPQAGAVARFLEGLFDEEERSDAIHELLPEAEMEAVAEAEPAPEAGPAGAEAEPEGPPAATVPNDEFDTTPPPGPAPEPKHRDPLSISKLLKRFGIK